ncbi:MAG: biopolymer transporter ExbB [Pseudomonadota bacterium]
MEQPDREAEPQFTTPYRQIIVMVLVLAGVGAGTAVAFPLLYPVFAANLWFNGFILAVFFVGVIACFWQLIQVFTSVGWIEGFTARRVGHDLTSPPRLLAPLAALLRKRGAHMQLGTSSSRSILDSLATRIDEQREITRYLVSLLIFLGLLGTFFGLATTVPALVQTIQSLTPQDGETGLDVFARLQVGLEAQLGGMGVAFASSLLGLAGSLVVGLLELFAGHGQNRFYRELEEWVSSITRVSLSANDGDGESGGEFGALAHVLDQMAEQIQTTQAMFYQSNANRAETDERLVEMSRAMERVADRLSVPDQSTAVLAQVAEGQQRLIAVLNEREGEGAGMDAESRMRLRSIDVQLLRLLEEVSVGRQEAMNDIRNDITSLTRAINAAREARTPAAPAGLGGRRAGEGS